MTRATRAAKLDSALASLRLPVDLSEATDDKLSYRCTLLDGKEGLGTFLVAHQRHLGNIINSDFGKGSRFYIGGKTTLENATSQPAFKRAKGTTYVCETHTRIADGKVSATLHLRLASEPPTDPYLTLTAHPLADLRWLPFFASRRARRPRHGSPDAPSPLQSFHHRSRESRSPSRQSQDSLLETRPHHSAAADCE